MTSGADLRVGQHHVEAVNLEAAPLRSSYAQRDGGKEERETGEAPKNPSKAQSIVVHIAAYREHTGQIW